MDWGPCCVTYILDVDEVALFVSAISKMLEWKEMSKFVTGLHCMTTERLEISFSRYVSKSDM